MFTTITRAVALLAVAVAPGAAAADGPDSLEAALARLDGLDRAVLSIDVEREPLGAVVERIAREAAIPLRADWDALVRLGVRERDRVDLRFDQMPVSTVLAALTLQLGDEFERPVVEAYGEQVILTTAEATVAMRLTDVYDVRDLLADGHTLRELAEAESASERPAPISDPPGEEDAGPGGDEPRRPPLSPGRRLVDLILDHVDPEAWLDLGGTRGQISEREGVLMVTVSASTHRRLRDALARLRRANPTGLFVEAALADLPAADPATPRGGRSGDRLGRAREILGRADAPVRWRTTGEASFGEALTFRSSAGPAEVELTLRARRDAGSGRVRIEIDARTAETGDERAVTTTITLAGHRDGAVIELPAARAGAARRVLVLMVETR